MRGLKCNVPNTTTMKLHNIVQMENIHFKDDRVRMRAQHQRENLLYISESSPRIQTLNWQSRPAVTKVGGLLESLKFPKHRAAMWFSCGMQIVVFRMKL